MMNTICSDNCIGCTACIFSCKSGAISMSQNSEGFYVAQINSANCVNCGMCMSVCPIFNGADDISNEYINAYAAYSKHSQIRTSSSSGGIFYSVAKAFIEKYNGVVFGVAFDEENFAKHICVENVKFLHTLQGSKYIQSDVNDCFLKVKEFLDSERYVLFSGTGCQISGLKRFLKADYNKLFTIDLICHGIPSPGLFNDYICYLEKKYGGKIVEYKFRQKNQDYKSQSYDTKITYIKNNKKYVKMICGDDDVFTNNYLGNKLQNNVCFSCKYTSLKRCGDITLGDYWGVHQVHREFDEINGISLVLANSNKGIKLLNEVQHEVVFVTTERDKIMLKNNQLKTPPKKNEYRDIIYSNYKSGKFNKLFYYKYFIGKNLGLYLIKRRIKQMFH